MGYEQFVWTLMSFHYLPYGGFKFLSGEKIKVFDLGLISETSLIGYILKVDLEYCWELHDLHNDYPLCPEKIEVSKNMLSNYCRKIADWYSVKVGCVKKLIPNLGDKFGYVVHYKNLKYYLSLGMKLVKILRVLKFKQSNWLKNMLTSILRKEKRVKICSVKICINY